MVLYFACIRENSLPSQRRDGCGLPITEEGLPITEEGLPITEEGLPITEEGLPITEEGLPVTGEGWVWAAKLSCEDYVHKL